MSVDTPVPLAGASLSFADLGLPTPLLEALAAVGYETPSPIQAATIPHLLAGRDVLGQAQTGTGKTAAFALPLLARIDASVAKPQALILAPTRELAIQVAEALQKYASKLPGFHVLPIYGGQSYQPQLSALKRGVHVIVGTPGRIIDHLDRGSLKLDQLKTLVLDEADEMLRMGFIDDVEKILQKTPAEKQVALFSATMPPPIKRIANTYLRNPAEVSIVSSTKTATLVRQRCLIVSSPHAKLDALTRILEVESFEGMIIFTRTKIATEELAEKLSARGYSAAALNGDIQQQQRERTVNKLKDGSIDIVVATDVAARGLDVERVSHVINYDVPSDPESYVHRIGRTGRAGREGDAILFISPRERGLLKMIERTTRKHIEMMNLPSDSAINAKRTAKFQEQVVETLKQTAKLGPMRELVTQLEQALGREQEVSLHEIAAALALMAQGGKSLLLSGDSAPAQTVRSHSFDRGPSLGHATERSARPDSFKKPYRKDEGSSERPSVKPPFAGAEDRPSFRPPAPAITRDEGVAAKPFRERPAFAERDEAPRAKRPAKSEEGMETFRIEVGHAHGVLPKNIVGAIANEADIDSKFMGRIDIRDDHSLIDLPEGMPKEVFEKLKKVWVAGQRLNISRPGASASAGSEKPSFKKTFKPKPRFGA